MLARLFMAILVGAPSLTSEGEGTDTGESAVTTPDIEANICEKAALITASRTETECREERGVWHEVVVSGVTGASGSRTSGGVSPETEVEESPATDEPSD